MTKAVRDNQGGIAILAALVICGAVNAIHRETQRLHRADPVTGIVRDAALVPGQTATERISSWFHADVTSLFNGPRLARQNAALSSQVEMLSLQNKQLANAQAQNAHLRALLNFQRKSPRPLLAAEVTALKPSPQNDTVVLNRGTRQGVHLHSIAIAGNGALIGQVIDVSPHSCTVLMLTDVESSVGTRVESTGPHRPLGLCKGQGGGQVLLTYLPTSADINPGDAVTTSGLGGVFPAGVPIGTIVSVRTDNARSMRMAVIRPKADLDRLDAAFILQ